MKKLLFFPPILALAFLAGCEDEHYYSHVTYADHPAYHGGYYGRDYVEPAADVDFYYEGGHPYSHHYGPLVYHENHYYYNQGGSRYVYVRTTHHKHHYDYHTAPYHTGTTVQVYR
jgi:hypothetical protein